MEGGKAEKGGGETADGITCWSRKLPVAVAKERASLAMQARVEASV